MRKEKRIRERLIIKGGDEISTKTGTAFAFENEEGWRRKGNSSKTKRVNFKKEFLRFVGNKRPGTAQFEKSSKKGR